MTEVAHYCAIVYGMEGDVLYQQYSLFAAKIMPQPHLLIRETQELKPQPLCLHFHLQNTSYQNLKIQICSQRKHRSHLTTGVLSL